MLERQSYFVEAIHQAMLAKRVDLKRDRFTVRRCHALFGEIDREAIAFLRSGFLEQAIDYFGVELDQQQAILGTVREKDIRKAWRDDRLKSVLQQRPWRVFAR